MKIFLVANTITPNLLTPFEEFIGRKTKELKVAFIPDAGLKNNQRPDWVDKDRETLIKNLKCEVHEITLENETPQSLEKLFEYDVIFVNGGYSGYLAKVMRKSGFVKILPELFKRNIIYVGSSAGAGVLSKTQDAASFYFGNPEPEALEIGGLGIVDFEFYPMHDHRWTEDLPDRINSRRNPNLKYYLVRDGQAISISDSVIKTHGDVIFLNKTS